VANIVEMDKRASPSDGGRHWSSHFDRKNQVDPEEYDLFIKVWATETEKFMKQPGFISTQLHGVSVAAEPSLSTGFGNQPNISREL
jgi:hypothetical protein